MNLERYSRQVLFAGIGKQGQEQLSSSRVVIIGCGALGSMQAEILARAGVGHIRLIDRDFVEEGNLHRQVMFNERDVKDKLPKAIAAQERIQRFNSEIKVEGIVKDVNYSNIEILIEDADVILDGTDNFEARYLINDAAVKHGKPWIYGAAVGAYGVQMTIRPKITPCLRCVFPDMPAPGTSPTCDTAGVILPIIAVVASNQATECIKLLTGQQDKLHGRLWQFDLWENKYNGLKIEGLREIDHECRTCGAGIYDFLSAKATQMVMTLCGRDSVQVTPAGNTSLNFADLAQHLGSVGEVVYNKYLLRLKLPDHEITIFPDARSIIKGTDDPNVARSLYARYIGA